MDGEQRPRPAADGHHAGLARLLRRGAVLAHEADVEMAGQDEAHAGRGERGAGPARRTRFMAKSGSGRNNGWWAATTRTVLVEDFAFNGVAAERGPGSGVDDDGERMGPAPDNAAEVTASSHRRR